VIGFQIAEAAVAIVDGLAIGFLVVAVRAEALAAAAAAAVAAVVAAVVQAILHQAPALTLGAPNHIAVHIHEARFLNPGVIKVQGLLKATVRKAINQLKRSRRKTNKKRNQRKKNSKRTPKKMSKKRSQRSMSRKKKRFKKIWTEPDVTKDYGESNDGAENNHSFKLQLT